MSTSKPLGMKRLLALLALLIVTTLCCAKEAAPMAEDEVVEKRMVAISDEMRCLVCQNESLSGSHAELAQDLRREIREMIKAGKSDQQIMDFMVDRYGDFVRYRPPMKATTLLLWFGPFLLLAVALLALMRYLRQRGQRLDHSPATALSADEKTRAEALLQQVENKQ